MSDLKTWQESAPAYLSTRSRRGCSVVGCDGPHEGLGFCAAHRYKFRTYGDPLYVVPKRDNTCTVDGCVLVRDSKLYCYVHNHSAVKYGDPLATSMYKVSDSGLKMCRRCGVSKPVGDFPARRSRGEARSRCKLCVFDDYLRKTFNITYADYQRMYEAQQGLCALCCQVEKDPRNDRLKVDHDHETGRVRGLLCYSCNIKLGWAENLGIDKVVSYVRS